MILGEDWITNKTLDWEYKKYLILDYAQRIEKAVSHKKLVPYLPDLEKNIAYTSAIIDALHNDAYQQKELIGFNFKKGELDYKRRNELTFDSINAALKIAKFGNNVFHSSLKNLNEVKSIIKEKIQFSPIGIIPSYLNEGFLILQNSNYNSVYQYSYWVNAESSIPFSNIKLSLIHKSSNWQLKSALTIKKEVILSETDFDCPATFLVESNIELPSQETFIPIAKEYLYHYLQSAS